MDFFIIDENNKQAGPFSIDELKLKGIDRSTQIWHQGMKEWQNADMVQDLKGYFDNVPPPPPKIEHTPPPYNINRTNRSSMIRYDTQTFTSDSIYDEYFDLSSLNAENIKNYQKNHFYGAFHPFFGFTFHIITAGIFTTIYCGLKHSKLPKLSKGDFGGGKAIGFLFIPIFNFYWVFVFWRHLAKRINLQYRLRNQPPPVSVALATIVCILLFIPYINLLNFIILVPILFSQIQTATNKLAEENIRQFQKHVF